MHEGRPYIPRSVTGQDTIQTYDHHHMHLHSLLKAKSQLYQMTKMAAAGSLMAEGLGVRHTQKNDPPPGLPSLTMAIPPTSPQPMVEIFPICYHRHNSVCFYESRERLKP